MRRILSVVAVALLISTTSLQAKENARVDQNVENAFRQEFAGADKVHWEKLDGAYQATFNYMGQRLIAYFSFDGDLISTTRYIYSNQLPFKVARELKEKFPDAEIQESVLEALYGSETVYFITVKDPKKEYLLKATPEGGISIALKRKING